MPVASANPFPELLLVEGAAPSSPAAGRQKLFIDTADNKLKRKNSGGTVTIIEGGGGGSGDVVGPGVSVEKEIALFDGTSGALLERATGTGYVKVTSGVMGTPAATVPISTDVGGLGTGVATALAINIGTAGAFGAFQFIEEQTPSGVGTITFSSLGAFTHLRIVWNGRGTEVATSSTITLRFNADTGANYDLERVQGSATTASAAEVIAGTSINVGTITAASGAANQAASGEIVIYDYRGTTFQKNITSMVVCKRADSTANILQQSFGGAWRNTAAITSITLLLSAGNYVAGSKFTLYGMR